jgi:hypothetical protein
MFNASLPNNREELQLSAVLTKEVLGRLFVNA